MAGREGEADGGQRRSGLMVGAPAPDFSAPSKINPSFAFNSVGGRYILLAFLPPAGPEQDTALDLVRAGLGRFHDFERVFFGVLPTQADFDAAPDAPPLRWFLDTEGEIASRYGMVDAEGRLAPGWVVIDPSLRILGSASLERGPEVVRRFLSLGNPDEHAGVPLHAPVLIVPRIFEPELCLALIEHYRQAGGGVSGVMRQRGDKTVGEVDAFKSRRDAELPDGPLKDAVRTRMSRRLLPQIEKAFSFKVTRVERWTIARYAADEGGYFRPHRDNGATATQHRKFACSINLNDDFEGGELVFAEYGWRRYRPPVGGAVVFGCGLLHEVKPVTRGERFAYLPFFYDEEGAKVRLANLHTLDLAAAQDPA